MTKILEFEKEFRSKKEKAQDIAWDAWNAPDSESRMALARRAIKTDPECTDAWVIMGQEEEEPGKKREYYQKAVDFFRKQHNAWYFEEKKGGFWGLLETRPFMRALQGLGVCQWNDHDEDDAIRTLAYMLELNPNDNQGIRFILVPWLVIKNRYAEARNLIEKYDSFPAGFAYTKLLLDIIEGKDEKTIKKDYAAASGYNRHVVKYILGKKGIPRLDQDRISFGGEDEAVSYMLDEYGKELWSRFPDAVEVLREIAGLAADDPAGAGAPDESAGT
jgi:tetratricopeptide (TPR) repeat protein